MKKDVIQRYIVTKGSKIRKIYTYSSSNCELRALHNQLHQFMKVSFTPSIFTKGYVPKKSIYHNAKAHMFNDYFIMLDVKDFFQNISHKQLAEKIVKELNTDPRKSRCNKRKPSTVQISLGEAKDLINICSINSRGVPLGFITSPILSNIYLKEFDSIVYGRLKKIPKLVGKRVIYTRYADDITISFQWESTEKDADLENEILAIVSEQLKRHHLCLNTKKTRSYNLNTSNHVRITGVNITRSADGFRRLSVGRKIKNELYWNGIKAFESKDPLLIKKVKGTLSFILSIEKTGFESLYSEKMIQKIRDLGFDSLKELIDSLPSNNNSEQSIN